MDYLPLYHRLTGQPCLVVGGGIIAERKVKLLLEAGAVITLVAIEVRASLRECLPAPHQVLNRSFQDTDLLETALVICATDDDVLQQRIARLSRQQHLPCNLVDNGALSSVIFPAIVDRSPLILAVASSGQSPVVTRRMRALLEQLIPATIAPITRFLGRYRDQLKRFWPDAAERRRVTEAFLDSPAAELASRGDDAGASLYFESIHKNHQTDNQPAMPVRQGEVYLVGAGPGDPDLLTLKALHLLQTADVVLHDNLVSERILARVRRDADCYYVGKQGQGDAMPQETINELLLRYAKAGNRVLRLKGGDPFIFGRGGEELESLIDAGIPCQIVPGVTAALGCAAYAGIPLTHRDYAQSVRFVTGHPKNGQVDLSWAEFAQPNQTIVFYMGLGGLQSICQQLMRYGRSPSTPVAIISKGTTPEQQTTISDLGNITQRLKNNKPARPTLIIVGEVVNYRKNFPNHSPKYPSKYSPK